MEKIVKQTYEQENLLDKFIRNERRSKLWAILSLLAFFAVSATVIVVAKNVAGNKQAKTDEPKQPPSIIIDTVTIVNPADSAVIEGLQERIVMVTDSLYGLQTQYELQVKETNNYIQLYIDCQKDHTATPPPATQPLTVLIHSTNVKADAIQKIKALLLNSGAFKNDITFTEVPSTPPTWNPKLTDKGLKTSPTMGEKMATLLRSRQPFQIYVGVKYFDAKYAGDAVSIATILNNNANSFTKWSTLGVTQSPAALGANIEIWISGIYVYYPIG